MTILELFALFSDNFCLIFHSDSECFAKYDAFCLHVFNYACFLIVIEEIRNYEKIV